MILTHASPVAGRRIRPGPDKCAGQLPLPADLVVSSAESRKAGASGRFLVVTVKNEGPGCASATHVRVADPYSGSNAYPVPPLSAGESIDLVAKDECVRPLTITADALSAALELNEFNNTLTYAGTCY